MFSILASAIALLLCGAIGGYAGYMVRSWLDLGGVGGAIVAVVVAMFVATLMWAAGSVVMRRFGLIR